ncbi:type II secretion system F family protein [Armatimonas rosea]|uniref:Type II secretory pathway component PulF n=1 Tax=Armatimonas rosea TaxID=685828 RepID=A0A7W9SV16_ARMRO|nr:type II secretion system F family protein [Armatimonas rosea]MBB6052558.1 type II secretory pathway component PulF [Armatimonas rosea]
MPTYSYHAKDNEGRQISGLIEAVNPSLAAASLREQGLFPSKIEQAPPGTTYDHSLPPTPNPQRPLSPDRPTRVDPAPFMVAVPLSELAMFYRQFATLLRSGVPLLQSLHALENQTKNTRLKQILRECQAAIASGAPLSRVMDNYPAVFTAMQVELVRAGETGGMLEAMCNRLADYLEREIEIRRKLSRETLYPKIVLSLAGLVYLIIKWTQAGMGASGSAVVAAKVQFAVIVAVTLAGLWWLGRFLNQFPAFGAAWDNFKMFIPGVGGVARRYATARFCRALGALFAGGINIVRAVEIAGRACGNRAIAQAMLDGVPLLMSGQGIGAVLAQSGVLSPIAVQMARTGEATGSLDDMLARVADFLESEADMKAHRLATVLGVVAILVAAVVVLMIAIQAYMGVANQAMSAGDGGGGD